MRRKPERRSLRGLRATAGHSPRAHPFASGTHCLIHMAAQACACLASLLWASLTKLCFLALGLPSCSHSRLCFAVPQVCSAAENIGYRNLPPNRSEEHTSELQSLMRISYAVFCLKK